MKSPIWRVINSSCNKSIEYLDYQFTRKNGQGVIQLRNRSSAILLVPFSSSILRSLFKKLGGMHYNGIHGLRKPPRYRKSDQIQQTQRRFNSINGLACNI